MWLSRIPRHFNNTRQWHNGYGDVPLPVLPASGTYYLQARVNDLAGNQGISALSSIQISDPTPWTLTADIHEVSTAGTLQRSHTLDLDQSPGTKQTGLALAYSSTTVQVRPTIQATLQTASTGPLPPTIAVALVFDNTTQPTINYSTASLAPGDVVELAAEVTSPITSSGEHTWTLNVSFPNSSIAALSVSGNLFVQSRDASIFGAGWGLSGIDSLQLIPPSATTPAGLLRLYGDGTTDFYALNGTT